MTPQVFAWPPSLWIVLEAINHVYQTVLLLPDQASTVAAKIDALHYFQITCYTLIAIAYFGVAIYFMLRYRRRGDDEAYTPLVTAPALVMGVGVGMFALFLVFWFISYREYKTIRTPPAHALDVYVTAKQWMWKFASTEGGASVGVLYVPVHQPIRLLITSRDVIHSFFVPAFRLKQDAVPGTYTTLWFEVKDPGTYRVMCAQMCGPGHARMWGQIVALSQRDYARWREGEAPPVDRAALGLPDRLPGDTGPQPAFDPAALGQRAAAQYGCLKCHTIDGQPHIGPTWLGLFGSDEPLADGTRVHVDEAYITQSMMDPTAAIVAGFQPVMPSYEGLIDPSDTAAIIEFIKSLRDVSRPHVVSPMPAGPIDAVPSHASGTRAPQGGRP
jgi:cytochrome c oxidase subunit 2